MILYMQKTFSPSVNIIRDFGKDLYYLPTKNGERAYRKIASCLDSSIKSFNIIGSYGTGKSAFIVALEKQLSKKAKVFPELNGELKHYKKFEFINVVGEFDSAKNVIRRAFYDKKIIKETGKDFLKQFEVYLDKITKAKEYVIIILDEFGKMLEHAAENQPEEELFFIQQFSELVNDEKRNVLFITTLHQNFDAYTSSLNKNQKEEWEKVKGRFIEIPFNEPVEHLLNIAAEYIPTVRKGKHTLPGSFKKLNEVITKSKAYPLTSAIKNEQAEALYPFDMLSAATLTSALQTYAQNERSLFTFLNSNDHFGILEFVSSNTNQYYNLSNVFDYIYGNFSHFIHSPSNKDLSKWSIILKSIERIESNEDLFPKDSIKVVKSLGLLGIFAPSGALINHKFLEQYGLIALNIDDPKSIIELLERNKIIRFRSFSDSFVLFEGTDLNIDEELRKAKDRIEPIHDLVGKLKEYLDVTYFPAKRIHYESGTPRYFKFEINNDVILNSPEGEIDGIISLVFAEDKAKDLLPVKPVKYPDALLHGFYSDTEGLKQILNKIEQIKYVLKNVADDVVAKSELKSALNYYIDEINKQIGDHIFNEPDKIHWVYNGEKVEIENWRSFNAKLSEICGNAYKHSPKLRNELINRHKLPGAISAARRILFENMISNGHLEDIGFENEKFPPEKTIYLTLLKNTGIHRREEGDFIYGTPTDKSFRKLWETGEKFIENSKGDKRKLSELVEIFKSKPFKLKQGLIEFWLPIFLYVKKDDFALFYGDKFLPNITADSLDLIIRDAHEYSIKTFDVKGVKLELFNKYRSVIQKSEVDKAGNSQFVETLKPFFSFYNGLPNYNKSTSRISASAIKFRDAIRLAKDPEEIFFNDLPRAFEFSINDMILDEEKLVSYIEVLQESITVLRTAHDELIKKFEKHLLGQLGLIGKEFIVYKKEIQLRFKTVKQQFLLPTQTVFFKRIHSALDDRNAWLNSLLQAITGKNVDQMTDSDEDLMYDNLGKMLSELDSFCEFDKLNIDFENEEIFKLEITNKSGEMQADILRYPKNKEKRVDKIIASIKQAIANEKDKKLIAASLVALLKEKLK